MRQNTENRILDAFYENSETEFSVRSLAKSAGLPRATVHKYLKNLKKQELISEENKSANSSLFKIKKINYFTEKIVSSGLIDYLVEELNPSCIILFGSVRKGESTKDSDMDIFIESNSKKELKLGKYEKILHHKIELFIESKITKLNENLLNNVVNGIKLYGSFKIK